MHVLSRLFAFVRCLALLAVLVGAASPAFAAKTYSDNGDGTVTDPTTGLTWMRCSMGQTWSGTTCTGTASTYNFIQAKALAGTVTFAGQSDWRLPNIRELQTIVDRSRYNPAIDSGAFPNTPSSFFSSGSSFASLSTSAWFVAFDNGGSSYGNYGFAVRLVRGGQSFGSLLDLGRPTADYKDNGDGTVTHIPTNLMWKRCAEGPNWSDNTCTGAEISVSYDGAQALSKTFAGKNDWRVPAEDELISLIDYQKNSPALNTFVFSAASSSNFWSGSPFALSSDNAWFVGFDNGFASGQTQRSNYRSVRLVRGGQCLGPLALTVFKTGMGQVASVGAGTGIQCSIDSGGYYTGDVVTLSASPAANLISWGGACASVGIAATCTVTMDAAKTVSVTFKDTPVVSALPSMLTFSPQNIASTSATQTVILTNTGMAALSISGITASGDFAVTNNCGAGIGAGVSCTLDIAFKPTAIGIRTGTLTLATDAPGSPHSIGLSGSGQGALASLSATSKTFTNKDQGTTSAAQTVTLGNTGTATLNISSITATGDFAVTNNCGAGVNAGVSCTLNVTFTPTGSGTRTGTLTIVSNAPGSPHTLSLSGTGNLITQTMGPISFSPATLYAGGRSILSATASSGLPVSFTSSTPVTCSVVGAQITGLSQGVCTLSASQIGDANYLSASSSQSIWVSAAPFSVTLTAPTALAQTIETVTFSGTVQGNTGAAVAFALELASANPILLSKSIAQSCSNNYCTTSFNIVFKWVAGTVSIGPQLATLVVTDSQGRKFEVDRTLTILQGTASISLAPGGLTFGTQLQGTTSEAQTVVVSNTGNITANLVSIVSNGDFAYSTTCGASLSPSASCNIYLTFIPTAKGTRSGAIAITSDTPGSPHRLDLSGTGGLIAQTINKIVFTPATLTVGGTTTANATASSGLAITFTSSTPTICSVSGTTVKGVSTGTCNIAADQAGNANYNAAPQAIQSITVEQGAQSLTFYQGWNLVGNGTDAPINVATTFSDTNQYTTIWKWIANQSAWGFYAPGLAGQSNTALADYATSKGYQLLTTIAGGEGFWVNAKQAASVDVAKGIVVGIPALGVSMVKGWNLVSTGESATPKQFNDSQSAAITTLWAWDATGSAWYFYAPTLDASGGLSSYATSKGYLDFTATNKTLGNGVGFWVNKP